MLAIIAFGTTPQSFGDDNCDPGSTCQNLYPDTCSDPDYFNNTGEDCTGSICSYMSGVPTGATGCIGTLATYFNTCCPDSFCNVIAYSGTCSRDPECYCNYDPNSGSAFAIGLCAFSY